MNLSLCLICLGQRVSEERRQVEPLPVTAGRQVMGSGRWSGFRLSRTPKGFRKIWCIQQLGHTIFLGHCVCVCVSLSPSRFMDLSAASDVERMHVRRDQCGVSAMQVIVTGSVIVKCKRVTRLLPWTLLGENVTIFGSSSMKEGQVLALFARSGLQVSATWCVMTHSKSFSAPLAV